MNLNTLSIIVSIAGVVIGLVVSIVGITVSVGIAVWSTFQLREAVKTAFQIDVQKMIDRIERNKQKFKESDPEAYKELNDVQEELDAIRRKFITMFGIK